MKKYLANFLFLFFVLNTAYASEKYLQTIQLNISGDYKNDVCFTTSDLFDGKHCGANASNSYDKGPKHYYLFLNKGSIKKDTGCSKYFNEDNKQDTPNGNGTLTIHVNTSYEAGYTSISGCYTTFISE